MHFMLVHASPVKTTTSCRNVKIFNKHTQSLRPKSELSAQRRSYVRLDPDSRDADIAWNISNFSSVEFPLDFFFFF